MAEEIKVSRTASPMQRPDNAGMGAATTMARPQTSKMPWIVLAVVVIVLVVIGFLFRDKLFASGGTVKGVSTAKSSGYQAVFLTNGQVYFGKVSNQENNYVTLDDIYYLQVTQPPLQGSTQPGQPAQPAPQPSISLVKLGQELHGPVDEMHISRAQILFYEDLKEDGQVVKAIKDYKATPAAVPAK